MKNKIFFTADKTALMAGTALLATLTVFVTRGSAEGSGAQGHPAVQVQMQVQATVPISDDYDYYPAYETYYSRNRHEYVYHDGNAWVRRPAPQNVKPEVLMAAPSVRMDFHDSPEQHHSTVVKTYPRNWVKPGSGPNDKRDEKSDRK